MARLVLSDASPLIALARVGGIGWLHSLFGELAIPTSVRAEVLECGFWPGQDDLHAALRAGWLSVLGSDPTHPPLPDLDEGEAACIRFAIQHARPALIVMDERAGRAVAGEHGIQVAGTAAVIGMAKRQGLIPTARAVFETLSASDFRLSREVVQTVLAQAGEEPG